MEGSPDSPRVSTHNPLTACVEVAHRWVPATGPRARRRKGDRAWCTTFLERGAWQTTTASTGSHPSEVPRGEREGHLPIDHIARDTFVISSESVRSGSGRSIVILLGQGKRFSDSIRLGRVEPRVENPVVAAWNGSQVHFSWPLSAINSSAAFPSLPLTTRFVHTLV